MGIVESILYAEVHKPPALPIAVMVNFNNYTGPPFLPSKPKCIPIYHQSPLNGTMVHTDYPANSYPYT